MVYGGFEIGRREIGRWIEDMGREKEHISSMTKSPGSLLRFAALGTDGVAGRHGPLLPRNSSAPPVHCHPPGKVTGSLAGVHPRPGQKCWIYLG